MGYIAAWEAGRLDEAITRLEQVCIIPPIEVVLRILQKCRESKSPVLAKRLLMYFRNNGLQDHALVGNRLVPALVDCGNILEAEFTFKGLAHKNEHSWTSLILWHARGGHLQHAFDLYQKMQENGIHPSSFTLVALLKSCANSRDITGGRQMHVDVVQKGFDTDTFVGNTLIDMYVKCKLTAEAWEVLNGIVTRDVVLWTSMIAGFAECGLACEAIKCFKQMQQEGISPNAFTFSSVLKACIDVDNVYDLHEDILFKGFERDSHVGKSLIAMYVKYYKLVEAQKVFDTLSVHDVVSWTALLSGYAEYGDDQEAVEWFKQMRVHGIPPDSFTFSSVLKACTNLGALEKGLEIHREIIQEGYETDPIIGSTLVSMYAFCDSLQEAQEVFKELPARCVVSWNALIGGFAEHGPVQEALKCMQIMQKEGIFPDAFTFSQLMKVSGALGTRSRGQDLHMETVYRGYEIEDFVGRSLVGMYTKLGLLEDAQEVFDQLYVQDVVSWTTLITGYTEHGLAKEALKCFDHMQKLGILTDGLTLACVLKACRIVGASNKGYQLHQEALKKGLETDPFVGTSLLDMYVKGGSPAEVHVMVSKLLTRDIISWNALISGFGIHEGHWAVQCFENMLCIGVRPDSVTFACVITACSHASLVLKGEEFFRMMIEDYSLSPTVEHYTCMIDLLARTGLLHEALKYLESMDPPPDTQTLRAFLNACKTYGGVELASTCLGQLVQINPDFASFNSCIAEDYEDGCIQEMRECRDLS
ncbi:hypothetical protein GOP47_0025033 [Adiantum capillus-veneris]|uniref:Pentatricopeptide repeat-containing protein n=1 Tax=Adiantum capillus-veneris TaxID=13818 RepID=A0A9D4U372_ADICA|nr:hypothetical protein GOP47_0025033 [Adiantum capillus-veneris]